MKVSICGLGYAATVSAGCFANDGHEVVGVDPIQTKFDLINQGCTPIIEQKIGEITTANVKSGRPRAVVDPAVKPGTSNRQMPEFRRERYL